MANVTILPPVLDLSLYAGDGVSFKLICKDKQSPPQPIDITGAHAAQIRVNRDPGSSAVVTFAVDDAGADVGEITLSLTGEQTQDLIDHESVVKNKFTGVWDIQWTAAGAEPRTLCQGKVECVADVTR